jgi:beta-phosphoglucomutase-like phosphatase (HAD superfamily)
MPPPISALISDVDGTLVTAAKVLTERTKKAVADLHARGIAFAIVSARPPEGMRVFVEPLGLSRAMAVAPLLHVLHRIQSTRIEAVGERVIDQPARHPQHSGRCIASIR